MPDPTERAVTPRAGMPDPSEQAVTPRGGALRAEKALSGGVPGREPGPSLQGRIHGVPRKEPFLRAVHRCPIRDTRSEPGYGAQFAIPGLDAPATAPSSRYPVSMLRPRCPIRDAR